MPQCCADKQALYTYDFDDGAPLSANFVDAAGNPGTTDCSIGVGEGINGSNSLHSDVIFSEASVVFPSQADICGNLRNEFAIGGYWKFSRATEEWYLCEVRCTNFPLETIISCYRFATTGSNAVDFVVFESVTANILFSVTNVFPEIDTLYKIEIRGSIGTWGKGDGWIELRVDGRVYKDGDDASVIGPDDPPTNCGGQPGLTILGSNPFNLLQPGWDKISWGPQGDLDCLYVKEAANYCDDNQVPSGPAQSAIRLDLAVIRTGRSS